MGKPRDPAYYVEYRAAHPEYRKRESQRAAERRKTKPREDRHQEYARRAARLRLPPPEPIPTLHQGHSLFEKAIALVQKIRRPDNRTHLVDPLYDDLVGEAILTMLSLPTDGGDYLGIIRNTMRTEMLWRNRNLPLVNDADEFIADPNPLVLGETETVDN